MSKGHLILASASPRRALLLSSAGFTFDVRVSNAVEDIQEGEPASETVLRLADLKARSVPRSSNEVVLAADTLVVLDGVPLGKPSDRAEALSMLALLAGRAHSVLTGWSVIAEDGERFGVSESRVTFKDLSDIEIVAYVDDDAPFDMAGAYGIQGENGRLISNVSGSRANVMGLPLREVAEALSELGIERVAVSP